MRGMNRRATRWVAPTNYPAPTGRGSLGMTPLCCEPLGMTQRRLDFPVVAR